MMYTPSDLFGSLVSDTEHLFDEIQSHRASSAKNVHGSPSPSLSLSPTPELPGRSLRKSHDEKVTSKVKSTQPTPSDSKQTERLELVTTLFEHVHTIQPWNSFSFLQ